MIGYFLTTAPREALARNEGRVANGLIPISGLLGAVGALGEVVR